ncbi:MAG: adenylate/guanylate cyclase domain-containing protein, partial [Pseudomonadota bacterium]
IPRLDFLSRIGQVADWFLMLSTHDPGEGFVGMAFSLGARQKSRRRSDSRIREALKNEEQSGLVLVLLARFVVLALLLVWAIVGARAEYAIVYAGILAVFAVLGILPILLRRFGISGLGVMAVFFTIDVLLLTYVLMVPGSMFPSTLTPQFNLQLPNFLYLCLFVVGMAISYSPYLVLWIGFIACVAWSIGMFWIISLPESMSYTFAQLLDTSRFSDAERVAITSSRDFVSLSHWYNRIVFLAILSAIVAVAVWRSRRLLQRQITSEAARANLSRYFSPNMVESLASGDSTLEDVNARKIAILFVDMIDFTQTAEKIGAHGVIDLLREYHGKMTGTVFAHGGTIDKYIGDALMANFGTPDIGPHDASNALRCAYALIEDIDAWNQERQQRGEEPVRIGIGLHYGDVVTGNIGDEHFLEFAVVGDTVNVASRLERLTRQVSSPLVVSADLVEKVQREGEDAAKLLAPLSRDESMTVKGRQQPVQIWKLVDPRP